MIKHLKSFILASVAVLSPIHTVLLATGVLITIDTVTGVWRAKVQGEKITSSGFRRTVTKVAAYHLAIITGFIIETYMAHDIAIVGLVSTAIAFTEGKSILENLSIITGIDLLSAIKSKLTNRKDDEKR